MIEASQQEKFIARVGTFEGPLDLLLSLIESRKLFINEFSLSEVTSDYAQYVTDFKNKATIPLYEITGYIVVLATLLLIKSRSLLPNFEINTQEQVSIDDLEDRLKIYKSYKEIAAYIQDAFGKKVLYAKKPIKKEFINFSPDSQITPTVLSSLLKDLLQKIEVETNLDLPIIEVKKTVTIEEIMDRINTRITQMKTFSFQSFIGHDGAATKEQKVFAVISFLAILELVRTGLLDVSQDNTYGDMTISNKQLI